ncbi:DHHC zinc finger domain-containing protein [Zalerion maritima]|uniref:Palmitoyltransferase n=1 Tax=Zalerion maritima TaxID=339359 RepID=A0AAD5RME9_9PEZI|nr:DHHC zinc finger domain-containing protein [Zalerion maritima]
MVTFWTIALIVLSISFIVFVIFFGRLPALRNTPIGLLHRLITSSLPSLFQVLDSHLFSGRLIPRISRSLNHIAYGRHPTILIFFLLLLIVGQALFLPSAWPSLSSFHKLFGVIAILLPYLFIYLSAYTSPGLITAENLPYHLYLYPYDFTLFHPGQFCKTCRIPKPARSKHCSVCGFCVSKMDHHCVFINACVGRENQHYFLLLLLSTAALTAYGACLGISILGARSMDKFPTWSRLKPSGMSWESWFSGWGYAVHTSVGLGSVTMLTALTSPMVWSLFFYQVYLIYVGTTTNESMKWSDWKVEMDDDCAFIRPLSPATRQKDRRFESLDGRWPLEPVQIMVRTDDGTMPAPNSGIPGNGDWRRVKRLADVENLYDLGFWDNLCDVFLPGFEFGGEGGDDGWEDDDVEVGNGNRPAKPVMPSIPATRRRRRNKRRKSGAGRRRD